MALFEYKAKDSKGQTIHDVLQAGDKKEAASLLRSDNLKILTIKSLDSKFASMFKGGISVSEKAAFCRFLATMLRAGLPLPEALDIIRQETQSKKLEKVLFDISFHIQKGETFSSVISKYKEDFDSVFLTMIKAGEESGTLEKSFDYLAKQLLTTYELSQKVKSSMMYPAVIIAAMIGNAFIMLGFVLPKMSDVFLSLNVDLPIVTRYLLKFGDTVGENLALTFGAFFMILFLVFMLFVVKKTRKMILGVFVKLPVIRKVMEQLDAARFARTLSTLLKSGASLSDILTRKKGAFPVTMVQTIKAGEKTGSLEVVLEELASFYEMEVDYSLKRATALLEPLLMLVIGVAVGAMVVLLITPIYSIVGGLEGNL